MDLDDDEEILVERKQIVVARLNLRDLTYRLRTAGMTAGERLKLEEMEQLLVLLGSFAFYKYQEAQEFDFCDHIWNFLNGIEPDDDIRSNVCL